MRARQNISTILFLLISINSFSQTKYLDFSAGTGIYNNLDKKPIHGGGYLQFEFEYGHSKKWAFSSGFLTSNYWYRDDESATSVNGIPFSKAEDFQINFLAKNKIYERNNTTIQAGAGLGLYMHSYDKDFIHSNGSYPITTFWYDLGFPISLELNQKIAKHFLIGLKLWTMFEPDFPFVGNHVGVNLKYRL